jgi:hypothetical protein
LSASAQRADHGERLVDTDPGALGEHTSGLMFNGFQLTGTMLAR